MSLSSFYVYTFHSYAISHTQNFSKNFVKMNTKMWSTLNMICFAFEFNQKYPIKRLKNPNKKEINRSCFFFILCISFIAQVQSCLTLSGVSTHTLIQCFIQFSQHNFYSTTQFYYRTLNILIFVK